MKIGIFKRVVLVFVFVSWGVTFLPSSVESEARSDFNNIVGIDVGIDVKKFSGPLKIKYNKFRWYMVTADRDSLFIDIKVVPYFTGYNSITYTSATGRKGIDDFPNR